MNFHLNVYRLDLDAWINEPEPELDDTETQMETGSLEIFYKTTNIAVPDFRESYQSESGAGFVALEDKEDNSQRREARRMEQSTNPHYLKSSSHSRRSPSSQLISQTDDIPIASISLTVPLQVSTSKKLSDKYLELEKNKDSTKKLRSKKDKKKKKKSDRDVQGMKFEIFKNVFSPICNVLTF